MGLGRKYVSAKDCKRMSRFKLFYKLKLGCSNVSKDKQVNSKAREEISWVESIWTYNYANCFGYFRGKMTKTKTAGL